MPRDQRYTQNVFRGLGPGAFLQKHRDKIPYMDRPITQRGHSAAQSVGRFFNYGIFTYLDVTLEKHLKKIQLESRFF